MFRSLAAASALLLPLPVRAQGQPAPKPPEPPRPPVLRKLAPYVTFTDPVRKPALPGRRLGRVDIPRTIASLQLARVTAYDFLIWQGPNDLDDLEELLPATRRIGVQVWVSIVPPTLGGNSLPYKGAWDRWCVEFARLARKHANLVALHLPDVAQGRNRTYLHEGRLESMKKTLNAAGMHLLGGIYDLTPEYVRRYGEELDGIVLHYVNMRRILNLDGLLASARKLAPRRWKIFPAFYAAPQQWDPRPAEPLFLYYAIRRALARADGFVIRDLDLVTPSKVRPGRAGFSNLLYTVADFIAAKQAGTPPQPPTYQ